VEREGKREPRQGRQKADRVEHRGKKTPTLVSRGREALRRGNIVFGVDIRFAKAITDA